MIRGIIYASGYSRRMEQDKLLLEIEGVKIIERVIRACVDSNLDEIVLVYRKEEIKEIGKKYNIKTVYNERAHLGQSESMKLGILEPGNTDAYMFIVGDQPFLNKDLINNLIEEYETGKSTILIPYYDGKRGMPMIMSSKYREELLEVEGDKGGRDVVKNYPEELRIIDIEESLQGMDIDTPADVKKIMEI